MEKFDKKLDAIKRELNFSVNLNNRRHVINKSKSTDLIKPNKVSLPSIKQVLGAPRKNF